MPRPYKGTWEEASRRREKITELYDMGWSAEHIGQEVFLSKSTVYYHLRVAKRRRRGRRFTGGRLGKTPHREIEKTIELYENGLNLRQVGERLGISHATVRYRLLNAGIPLRPAHKNNGGINVSGTAKEEA